MSATKSLRSQTRLELIDWQLSLNIKALMIEATHNKETKSIKFSKACLFPTFPLLFVLSFFLLCRRTRTSRILTSFVCVSVRYNSCCCCCFGRSHCLSECLPAFLSASQAAWQLLGRDLPQSACDRRRSPRVSRLRFQLILVGIVALL